MKRIKIPRLFNPKKMLAATARRASAASAGMDFEGIPEPNMKLSRALLIVLLLHVVAVSGIIAFNAIKTRERAFVPPTSTETENKPADTAETANHASTLTRLELQRRKRKTIANMTRNLLIHLRRTNRRRRLRLQERLTL